MHEPLTDADDECVSNHKHSLPDLTIFISDLFLRNPTVLASGILGGSYGQLKRVEEAGAGALTTKTITKDPRTGYINPVFVDLGYGYLNAIGLRNPGVEQFSIELSKAKKDIMIPIIASVGGTSIEEFTYVAEKMVESGSDAIELNLSCPHVGGYGLDIGSDVKLTKEIIKEVKSISDKPLLVKISLFHSNKDIIEKFISAGLDGITAINTLKALAIDINSLSPVLSNILGGLSGPCIKPVTLAVIYEIYREFPDIPIIGVGGVEKAEDAIEMILAGASAVGIGSAIVRRDLEVFTEVTRGIERFMLENGFKSIKELIGYIHRR
ncbi:MAG: dihydroorotate dehydrogenase [Nitrososphaerota archaeon]